MTGIDLILIFFSSLFTSGFSAEVDLIYKSKVDYHTIGLVSTSQGSYYVNSTLDDYDGGDNSIPFAWRPPTLDDIDFLQFDFRVPHKILKAAVILNPFGGLTEDGAPLTPQPTKFFVALSKDGINWQLNTDATSIHDVYTDPDASSDGTTIKLEKGISGTNARFVRFYSVGHANETTEWSFKVFGEAATDYVQFSTSDHTTPCHGYQARIDYSVVGHSVHTKCDQATVSVLVDGQLKSDFLEENAHSMYMETLSMPNFQKCVFSLVIEAFQSTQNATYQLKVEMPGINDGTLPENFQSEELDFEVSDDGVPDEELLYIVTEGGNYFVSTAPYNTFQVDPLLNPKVYIGNMDTIRKSCSDNRDNADVLDISLFDHFQAGGTNSFIETLMHFTTSTPFANQSIDSTFLMFQDAEEKQCVRMNSEFEIEIFICDPTQHQVDFIFCLHTEGEISSIQINSTDCKAEADYKTGCVEIELQVMAVLMGARLPRNLTCTARDFNNAEIGQPQIVTAWNRQFQRFKVHMCFDDGVQISKVACFANRKFVTSEENPLIAVDELEFPTELDEMQGVEIQLEGLDREEDQAAKISNVYYLNERDYNKEYQIVMTTSGYPLGEFSESFEKKYNSKGPPSKDNVVTQRKFVCDGEKSHKIKIESIGTRTFDNLIPDDSGKYHFSVDTVSSSFVSSVAVELVHPFKIQCDPSCGQESRTLIGRPYEIACSVNHHLLSKASEFAKENKAPLKIKIGKIDSTDDLGMNPCEYNLPVETTLTSKHGSPDILKFDEMNRKLDIKFRIKSFQPWHEGAYYISMWESNSYDCYYAENKTDCPEHGETEGAKEVSDCPQVSTDKLWYLDFKATPNSDVGAASANVEGVCSRNPRAMYFEDPAGKEQDRFYYKICDFVEQDRIPPEDVCGADGGEPVDMGRDFVANVVYRSLTDLDPKTNPSFMYDTQAQREDEVDLGAAIDLTEAWEVLTCNFKFQNREEAKMKDDEMKYFTFNVGQVTMVQFRQGQFEFTGDTSGKTGLMCRYRRGFSWDIYAPGSNCRYEPLDISKGLVQKVVMKTHGNLRVSFLCEAIPFGSYKNESFDGIIGEEGLQYKLKYPEELDVEKIRCIQKPDPEIFASEEPPNFEWKEIEFSSTPLRLNVRDVVDERGLWCADSNFSLAQPCYGSSVSLTACAEGNPLQSCKWERHNTNRSHNLQNGTDGVWWDLEPEEWPQCNNTRICSTLTFESLREDQQGFYYFKCLSGTEGIKEMPPPVRRTSKTVKIFSQQSSPEGSRQLSFFIDCAAKTMRGFARFYGPAITATVKCKHSKEGNWEPYPVEITEPGAGAYDVNYVLERATRESVCEISAHNSFNPNPISFQTDLKKLDIVNSVAMRREEGNEKRFCCSVCAFAISKQDHMPIKCYLGQPTDIGIDIPMSNVTKKEDFVVSEFSTKRCVTLKVVPKATFSCSCKVGELGSAVTVRGSGSVEVVTPPPVTEPKFQTFKLPELTTTPFQEPKTTAPPSTTEPSVTVVYINRNDYLLAQAKEEVERFTVKTEVVYTEFFKSVKEVEFNIRENPPQEIIQDTLAVLQNIPKIVKFTTNETEATREKLDDMADKLVTSAVDIFHTLTKMSPSFAADEPAVMAGLATLEKALLHVGSFLPANKSLEYKTEHMNVKVQRLPERKEDYPAGGMKHVEVDHRGVTKNAIQGGRIPLDQLKTAPEGSVAAMVMVGETVANSKQRLQHKEWRSGGKDGEYEETQIFNKRVGDVLIVSCSDPEGNKVSLGVEYDLNLHQAQKPKSTKGRYQGEFVLSCMYFNEESSRWVVDGMKVTYQDESRGSCSSQHTTQFSILAQMKSFKSDPTKQKQYQWMAWILFMPASVLIAGCFLYLLYIHEALQEQQEEEQNIRRLLTLLAFQTFLCAYLGGAQRTDTKGACAVSQIGVHAGMLAVVGCLLNEIVFLLKEVTPSLWKKQYFPLIYFLNTVALPVAFSLGGFLLSLTDEETHYSCFFPHDTLRAYLLVYTPMVLSLLIGGVILHKLIYHNALKLSRQMEEYDIPDDLEFSIKATVRILLPFPPLFIFYVFIMSQESAFLHVLMGLLGLAQALLLMLVLVTSPLENQAAWFEMKNSHLAHHPKKKINRKAKLKQQVVQNQYNVPDDSAGGGGGSRSPNGKSASSNHPRAGHQKHRRGLLAEDELELSDSERSTLSALSNDLLDSGSSRATSVRSARST